jgi:aspartate-semialdehyde dehydrogenase
LKALDAAFGLETVCVSTYQAISGAGYPGIPSLDILGNVLPYIKNEEEKMEEEIHKMLGTVDSNGFKYADFDMVTNCARVPVMDGHLESMIMMFRDEPDIDDVSSVLSGFSSEPQRLRLPTAPLRPIIVSQDENRPQPLLDAYAGEPARARGMAVTVGRLRKKNRYYKAFVLSHNTLRGGSGGSVLNAELAVERGHLR